MSVLLAERLRLPFHLVLTGALSLGDKRVLGHIDPAP
jgi:hypothetical protein